MSSSYSSNKIVQGFVKFPFHYFPQQPNGVKRGNLKDEYSSNGSVVTMAGYPSYSVCSPAYKRSSVASSLPGAKSVSRNYWLDSVRNFIYTESFICHIDEHSSVLFPLAFFTFNIFYFLKVGVL